MPRTLLVTGASSGIGRAVAHKLLQQGHRVIGVSRKTAMDNSINENFYPLPMDLADLNNLPEQLDKVKKSFPELDGLICCAGQGRFGHLEEFSFQQIDDLLAINLTSQIFLTRALLPLLKQKPRGDIIFIGSEAALKGSRKGAVYCASKFGLRGFSQALREECGKSLVRVCLVNPGMVKTEFFQPLDFAPGDHPSNYLVPEDVADAVAYVLGANPLINIDEINLNPLNKVVKFKKKMATPDQPPA